VQADIASPEKMEFNELGEEEKELYFSSLKGQFTA